MQICKAILTYDAPIDIKFFLYYIYIHTTAVYLMVETKIKSSQYMSKGFAV